jgi:hypothetical protein
MGCTHSPVGEEALCNEHKTYTASLLYTLSHISAIHVMLQTEPDSS